MESAVAVNVVQMVLQVPLSSILARCSGRLYGRQVVYPKSCRLIHRRNYSLAVGY